MKKFQVKTYGTATFEKTYILDAEDIKSALEKIKSGDISPQDWCYTDEEENGLDIDNDDLDYCVI